MHFSAKGVIVCNEEINWKNCDLVIMDSYLLLYGMTHELINITNKIGQV